MGVQSWRAKAPLIGAKKSSLAAIFQLLNEQGQQVGYLLFATQLSSLAERAAEIRQLSNAMLTAIKLKAQPENKLVLADLAKQKILIFGKDLAKNLASEINLEHAVAIYHPAELLQNPGLKREAWQGLQNFLKL